MAIYTDKIVNKMKATKYMLVAAIGIVAFGCSNDEPSVVEPVKSEPIVISMTPVETKAVECSSDFGLRLFREVCASEEGQGENVFMSPLSASVCLSMLANGATGETQQELLRLLGVDDGQPGLDALNSINSRLAAALPITDAQTRLLMANSVWVKDGIDIKDSFREMMESVYQATIKNAPLDTPEGIAQVNRWASDKTSGMIPSVMNQNDNVDVALINALYFKGEWTSKFSESNTDSDYFTREDGIKYKVKMMKSEETLGYTVNEYFRIVSKPFGNKAYSMFFLLPVDGSLSEALTALTTENWRNWISEMGSEDIKLKVPRYKLECGYDLIPVIKGLGCTKVFTPDAELDGMLSVENEMVDVLRQKTAIEVNEEGARAAAATIVGVVESSAGPLKHGEFYLDRPFAFMITEQSTGAIVFAGKVERF